MENFFALFRPYRITLTESEGLGKRLGNSASDTSQIQNFETKIAGIETKSGILLTHVSMMIAISGIMLSVQSLQPMLEWLLTLELVAYLSLAVICIRCQYQLDTSDFDKMVAANPKQMPPRHSYIKVLAGEWIYREKLFRFAFRALYLLTCLLVMTVIFSLITNKR